MDLNDMLYKYLVQNNIYDPLGKKNALQDLLNLENKSAILKNYIKIRYKFKFKKRSLSQQIKIIFYENIFDHIFSLLRERYSILYNYGLYLSQTQKLQFNNIYHKLLEKTILKVCKGSHSYKLDELLCIYIIKRNIILNPFLKKLKDKENIKKELYTGYSICYIYEIREKYSHLI